MLIKSVIVNSYFKLYHSLLFRINHIKVQQMPVIHGRIFIKNKGQCFLGDGLIFNNSHSSNWVGMNKPCSIYIAKDAIVKIGDNSGFSGVSIYSAQSIIIGKYVNVGGNVSIWDTDFHPLEFNDRRVHQTSKINSSPILIDDDVFIGANSIILKGITIGKRSIIGAGSVVTKSVPSDQIWAGNPAKFIRVV